MEAVSVYERYRSQSVQTLTPGEMVVKLFDETAKQISMAIYESPKDRVKSFNCITKATRILQELNQSLNMNIPVSSDLRKLYEFLIEELYETGGKGEIEGMQQVLHLVNEMKVTFRQAEKLSRMPAAGSGG